jgi:hydroxyethylthiazole kinase-like uncharacterized protein yjeF
MLVLTRHQSQLLDNATIAEGISSARLMNRAARAVQKIIQRHYAPLKGRRVLVCYGPGNNGGDARLVAAGLKKEGAEVLLWSTHDRTPPTLKDVSLVVDGLYGTGLSRPITGLTARVISLINASQIPVVSIDIPSGLDADSGQILGKAIRADRTVTFEYAKQGFFDRKGPSLVGHLDIESIGLSQQFAKKMTGTLKTVTASSFPELKRPRSSDAHKGTYGHVFVFGGGHGKIGASMLAAQMALKAGCGRATIVLPDSSYRRLSQEGTWNVMFHPVPDGNKGYLNNFIGLDSLLSSAKVVVMGPGLGKERQTKSLVTRIIKEFKGPLIVDADALNLLGSDPKILKTRRGPTLLTPHPAEMGRLIGKDVRHVLSHRLQIVQDFSQRYQVTLLLKGRFSLMADPDGWVSVNLSGGPQLANAGQGDLLCGLFAGVIAEFGWSPKTLRLAPYLHGMIADYLTAKWQGRAFLPIEILDAYNQIFRRMIRSQ